MEQASEAPGAGAPGWVDPPKIRRLRRPEPVVESPPAQVVLSLVAARQEGEMRRARAAAEWAAQVRRFSRSTLWALPVAAIALGLSGWFGRPPPGGFQAFRWLVLAQLALASGLLGVIALTGLLIVTKARRWALVALLVTIAGVVTLGPVAGLVAVVDRSGRDGAGVFVVGIAGVVLAVLGWVVLGAAVIKSGLLNGSDGVLLMAGAGAAGLAALVGQSVLQVIAAMLLLAAGLGIAWSGSRLTADGQPGS